MNIAKLKERISKVASVEWNGETIYMRKLSATEGVALISRLKKLAEMTLGEERDRLETIDYQAAVISKVLCDEQGQLELDSDEGRATISQLPFDELCDLGELCQKHGGLIPEKKSSTKPNVSLSDSASHSESSTPTPCTLS